MSIYMKDTTHRLVLLKFDPKTNRHNLEIAEELEDEIVSMQQIRGWK